MNIEDVKDNQLWIFYEEDFDESYMQEDIDACWSKDEKCSYFMMTYNVDLDKKKTTKGQIVYRDGMAYGRTQCLEDLVNNPSWTLETNSEITSENDSFSVSQKNAVKKSRKLFEFY